MFIAVKPLRWCGFIIKRPCLGCGSAPHPELFHLQCAFEGASDNHKHVAETNRPAGFASLRAIERHLPAINQLLRQRAGFAHARKIKPLIQTNRIGAAHSTGAISGRDAGESGGGVSGSGSSGAGISGDGSVGAGTSGAGGSGKGSPPTIGVALVIITFNFAKGESTLGLGSTTAATLLALW